MLNRQTRTNLSIYSWILYYNVRLVAAILRVCFECQLISVWSGHSIGMDWQYGFQQWYNFDCFQIILDTFGVSVLFLCCLVGEVDFCANKWNYRKQPYNKCHTLEYIRLDSAMYVSAGQILLETVLCLCHRGKNRFFVSFASNFISHSCFIHWTRRHFRICSAPCSAFVASSLARYMISSNHFRSWSKLNVENCWLFVIRCQWMLVFLPHFIAKPSRFICRDVDDFGVRCQPESPSLNMHVGWIKYNPIDFNIRA